MKQIVVRYVLIVLMPALTAMKIHGQVTMPEVLIKNSLKEQLNYIEEHTRIYEDYRAIREDMFQKIRKNVTDTLSYANLQIGKLGKTTLLLNQTIDSLKTKLESTKSRLEEMTRTKDSLKLLGLEVNKSTYNRVMWLILAGLAMFLLIGFMIFRRNLSVISNTKKEIKDLKAEFEAYRKTSREAREKLTMDHFNEIKKLKAGG
jgi:hypothetical protein